MDVISVGLIVLGALVAGARDLSYDFHGYAIVFLANFTTAIYLATISRIGSNPAICYLPFSISTTLSSCLGKFHFI